MSQLTVTCICDPSQRKDSNKDNLLFAGQILPERNGGLTGTPAVQADTGAPFAAAVFRGLGPDGAGEAAAYRAASAFRSAADGLGDADGISALLGELSAAADDFSAAAVSVTGSYLSLADVGQCRVYLCRGRSLYLLSQPGAAGSAPHTVSGKLRPGDRVLLCTGTLCAKLAEADILKVLLDADAAGAALQTLAERPAVRAAADTVTAILMELGA